MSPQLFFADLSAGFDAPQLLPWLAAGGLPLLLAWQVHRRLPRVAFGGFQLLREAARATAGWPVSASWLIVALRMVLLAAAALAAAGPYVVSRSAGAGFLQQDFEKQGRVLVVAEQPTETAAANEPTSRAVLAAFAAAGNGLRPIAAEPVATLAEALAAGRSRHVLVICDGLVPSPQEATDWWQWIEAGGAGLVLLGPETLRDRGWPTWQQSLTSRTGLTFAGVVETGGSQLAAGAGLPDRRSAGKPLVGGLTAVPGPTIERLVGLGLPHQLDEFATLAVTGNQQLPTAVCRPLGRGAITVSALPLSLRAARPPPADPAAGRWSDLTAWPVFLPYFRGLVGETVAGCRTAGSGLNARWSIPRLPSLLLLVALLALGAEAALTTVGAAGGEWRRGRPVLQRARWWGGLARAVAAVTLVALAWQVTRPPSPVDGGQTAEAPAPDGTASELVEAELPPLCWPGEEVEISVTLSGRLATPARLALDGPAGRLAEMSLAPTVGTVAAADAEKTVRLLWQVPRGVATGPSRLQLRCLPPAGTPADAAGFSAGLLEASTRIADRPARLLLVDAEPRFEYRFARQALAGDPRFTVTAQLLAADQPIAASDWADHDVVWLGDCLGPPVESAGFSLPGMPAAAVESLGQRLATGRLAVAWQPGERFRCTGFAVGRAAEWLPVRADGPLTPPLRTGSGLPLTSQPAGIAAGWLPADRPSLGRVYGLLRPVVLRPTTVALATAVAGDSGAAMPGVVLGRHGQGAVLCHLCETWRWRADRLPDGKNLHETYWRQTLCRLATPPLLRRLGVEAEAISWPQRFTRPQPAGSGQVAQREADSAGPWHWRRQLLLAMLVAACLVAWRPQPWSTQSREG